MLQALHIDDDGATEEEELLVGEEPISESVPEVTITLRKVGLQLHDFKLHTPVPRINQWLGGGGSKQHVLQSISATMPAGKLIAVMGPSGCGKTSLLNVLSGRLKAGEYTTITGDVLFNGHAATKDMMENLTGYVLQGDFLHPHLTVYETLACSAMLRLPSNLTRAQKMSQVENVLSELGLRHCRNTRIGNDEKRGISGGEKRRVSIGMQLLTNPSVLFLDEPTSGLDSFMARNVVDALKRLALQGRTVICTIHQPRSDIFHLFDSVLLLTKGRTVYYGDTKEITQYFASFGYPCPEKSNPADFILDVASVDKRNSKAEAEGNARIKKLIDHYATLELATEQSPPEATPLRLQKQKRPGFFLEFAILVIRGLCNLYRDKRVVGAGVIEAVMVSMMIGSVFYNLGHDLLGIRNRGALFYTISHLQFQIMLNYNTYQLTQELPVYDRERQDNLYRSISFVLARTCASFPIDIIFPFLFSSIVYWMAGLRHDFDSFALFVLVTGVHLYCSFALSWFCASVTRSFAWGSLLGNGISIFAGLSCGFLMNPLSYPSRIAWFKYADPIRYAYDLMMINEFRGRTFPCPTPDSEECYLYDGKYILESAGVSEWKVGYLFAMQVLIIFCFRAAAFIVLILFPRVPAMSAPLSHSPLSPPSSPYGTFTNQLQKMTSPLCISLEEVNVELKEERDENRRGVKGMLKEGKRRCRLIMMGARGEYTFREKEKEDEEMGIDLIGENILNNKKTVLRNVSGELKTGELIVLMGGSGSGKTTLLNTIAGRGDHTKITGEILVNGRDMREELKYLTGYVLQNDYLHPCLTVRECLMITEKTTRVDEIILELGLKDCANTLIGDDYVRGISGGEKRRVSIAAQLLTDPSILLLDEPTSGLDAFTAHHIIDSLKRIARQGRIILCSIHQPRSDIFHMFDKVILLTHGRVAFFGPSRDVLGHFAKLGYECPNDSNPADFLLDISSIDDRDSIKEQHTTNRVNAIVDNWSSISSSSLLSSSSSSSLSSSFSPGSSPPSSPSLSPPLFDHQQNEEPATSLSSRSMRFVKNLMIKPNSSFVAVPILIRRSFRNMTRQPLFMVSRVLQSIAYSSVLAIYFTRLTDDQLSVQNRIGVLYMAISITMVGMLNGTAFFPPERNVFYRENADGSYSSLSFYLMYTICEVAYDVFMAITFSSVMFFIIGMEFYWDVFCEFCFIMFLLLFTGESIGAILNMFVYDVGLANAITSSILSFFGIMSGFVSSSMISFLDWINIFSIIKYAALVISVNHFDGMTFTCDTAYCPFRTGDEVLALYGFDKSHKWHAFGAMVGLAIGYRVLGGIILQFLKKKYAQ